MALSSTWLCLISFSIVVWSDISSTLVTSVCSGVPNYGSFAKVAVPESFVSRDAWSAASFGCSCDDITEMSPNHITIHHTATSSSTSVSSIQNIHMNTNGWCDIGYHFLIDVNGNIYQGRPFWDDMDLDTTPEKSPNGQWPTMALIQGAHVSNQNENNIGIALIGCFDSGSSCDSIRTSISTSSPQYDSLVALVAYLAERYGINISGSAVEGHSDLANTLCPGSSLESLLSTVVSESSVLVSNACSVPYSGGGDDIRGECLEVSSCTAPRMYTAGHCPGPSNIRCCHNKPCTAWSAQVPGTCFDETECGSSHDHYSVSGQCPQDPNNIKCCVRHTCETSTGIAGVCMEQSECDNGRVTTSGLCSGPSSVKCCYYA